ncbi:MAG TPA: ABC transporter ATP-binding protein [Candidatus Limnocylindrales bacterium]|nr:ABC transporter ATP-binding protein [Candidatus Limnocylindrales bacterium]
MEGATIDRTVASAPVVEMRGLVKHFAEARAVDGIDLDIPAGGVYGLLGPNGAGKTTTIRILAGLLWPTRGAVRVLGEPVEPGARVLGRVGCLIERPALYPWLSATDNLRVFATMRGMSPAEQARAVPAALDRVGLAAVARRKAGGFSTGMRQRLALAVAFLGGPVLVILDEPTNGLDPNGVVDVRRLIKALAGEGTTIILSSHVLPEVEQLCDRIAIMRDGRIAAAGPARDVLGTGERLFVRFDAPAQAAAAYRLLGERRPSWPLERAGDAALLVEAAATDASGLNRLLGEASIFPAELGIRRPSLEDVFRELTLDQPDVAAAELAS